MSDSVDYNDIFYVTWIGILSAFPNLIGVVLFQAEALFQFFSAVQSIPASCNFMSRYKWQSCLLEFSMNEGLKNQVILSCSENIHEEMDPPRSFFSTPSGGFLHLYPFDSFSLSYTLS
jgi:hypothetical protein